MKKYIILFFASFLFLASCSDVKENSSEENKKIVMNFYQEFFGDKNIDAADKYIGDLYIQHNPSFADGREALKEAVKWWFENAPKTKISFINVAAENDIVFVQTGNENDDEKSMIVDVFRVTNGKITEHWDAFANFSKNSPSQNPTPLF